jgi:hypothetical protein
MKKRKNIIFTIGIDKYESRVWKNLDNAVLDSRELMKILIEKYSFIEYPDSLFDSYANKKNIYEALLSLKYYVEPDDNLIIFYAGHGNMNPHTHRGYWIPYEGTMDISTWIENSVIKDFIQDLDAQHICLIADSCFSGTFLTRTRGAGIEIKYEKIDLKKSRWMLASGREEKVSDGIPGAHSPFCKYLIKYLDVNTNNHTCISEIIKYVEVLTRSNSTQTPRGAFIENVGHEDGEMVLNLKDDYIKNKIEITRGTPNTPELRLELSKYQQEREKLATGKELLIVESFIDDFDYLILENFRFDEKGKKKNQFSENQVIIDSEKENKIKLIQRFATWQGLNRYLELNAELYKSVKTLVINARKDIEKVEEELSSITHADYLYELLEFNKDIMSCLHCGEKITTNDSYLIEIDELSLRDGVGNVHKECLRPADRILGNSGYKELIESKLVNFDIIHWCSLLEKGQGQLTGIKHKIKVANIATIAWNPENNRNVGNYCIRVNYDNGQRLFMKLGKEIHRFKRDDIDKEIEFFNQQHSRNTDNQECMIVENRTFGSFELLSKQKTAEQTISKVIRYEKALYSKQFEENSFEIENDYTPIGLIKYAGSDDIIKIGNIIPFISEPEDFETFYENWNEILGNLDKCSIKIIETDFELDTYLQLFFSENLQPIIDPLFNLETKDLKSGLKIMKLQTIIAEAKEKRKPFKIGDFVKLVFPDIKTERFPTGILLTDDFKDELGESCVIFQPVENGKPLKDMQYKIPTKIVKTIDK